MQYWVISNFRLIWSYLGVLSTHTHASNIKKPLCQPRIQVKIPLKPGSTTLSRTHWHTDNICMQIPQSLGPTTLSPPILVTSNPQKYPNMERWSVHPFFSEFENWAMLSSLFLCGQNPQDNSKTTAIACLSDLI